MRTRPLPVAAVVLGAVFATERLAAAPTSEETQKGPAPNEHRLKKDDISRNVIVKKGKRAVSTPRGQASYEYQDWFDWKPQILKPQKPAARRPATVPGSVSRPPSRSDY